MRRMTTHLMVILVLGAMTVPLAASASHDPPDERLPTPFEEFHREVRSWIDPWLANSESDLADDHAPLVAYSLYESLLSIKPEPCYWDTYAAYWAVAADIRVLGEATSRGLQQVALERIMMDLAHAEALARDDETGKIGEGGCRSARFDGGGSLESETKAHREPGDETRPARVIEIEATASLQFRDERGDTLEHIAVTPGETVLFRVDNTAGFDHNFYVGSEHELEEPEGVTDTGISTWTEGVRELEWIVPSDVSGLMFGCTVPGHFTPTHGIFTESLSSSDTARRGRATW
jgi:hypothetical protein